MKKIVSLALMLLGCLAALVIPSLLFAHYGLATAAAAWIIAVALAIAGIGLNGGGDPI